MTTIRKKTIVTYSQEKMYHLVNDVDSYSQFVPFCQRSGVESIDGSEVTAFLEINFGGITKKLKTKNTLTPTSNIKVDLVEGPVDHLVGNWHFCKVSEDCTEIIVDFEFNVENYVLKSMIEPILATFLDKLIDSFKGRAELIYD